MKKIVRGLMVMLAALALTRALSVPAWAEASVSFGGREKGFTLLPGSAHSATDLFPSFKDVMPGDAVTERIQVKNEAGGQTVKIYLRALGARSGSEAFLAQLQLTVRNGRGEVLSADTAEQAGDLAQWTLLDTLAPGQETTLDLTLEAPLTMGDAFQDATGTLQWEFKAEELPGEPGSSPHTGDESNPALWMALALAAGAGSALLLPAAAGRHRGEMTR